MLSRYEYKLQQSILDPKDAKNPIENPSLLGEDNDYYNHLHSILVSLLDRYFGKIIDRMMFIQKMLITLC